MRTRSGIIGFLLAAILSTASMGQTIVWTDQDSRRIQSKDVTGGAIETIVQFPSGTSASAIHFDPVEAKLYYRLSGSLNSFQRSNLDGSDPENIPTSSIGRFTLNVDSRKLYWTPAPSFDAVHRSELDGSGATSHTYPSGTIQALEAFGDNVFFGAGGTMEKGIWRADADGSNEQWLHSTGETFDLAHDPVESKVYTATAGFYGISRINLDGTGFEVVVLLPQWDMGNSYPSQVAVDSQRRKLYWADKATRVIQRSNLDGSNVEDFVTAGDVGNPSFDIVGLTVVYNPQLVPAVGGWGIAAMGSALLGMGVLVLRKRLHPVVVRELGNSSAGLG